MISSLVEMVTLYLYYEPIKEILENTKFLDFEFILKNKIFVLDVQRKQANCAWFVSHERWKLDGQT